MLKNQSENIGCFGLLLMLTAIGFGLSGSGNQVIMAAGLLCSVLFLFSETVSGPLNFKFFKDAVFAMLGKVHSPGFKEPVDVVVEKKERLAAWRTMNAGHIIL